jgi:hypothetical protein
MQKLKRLQKPATHVMCHTPSPGVCAHEGYHRVLRMPADTQHAEDLPHLHPAQHARQAHPLRGVGQGAFVRTAFWKGGSVRWVCACSCAVVVSVCVGGCMQCLRRGRFILSFQPTVVVWASELRFALLFGTVEVSGVCARVCRGQHVKRCPSGSYRSWIWESTTPDAKHLLPACPASVLDPGGKVSACAR